MDALRTTGSPFFASKIMVVDQRLVHNRGGVAFVAAAMQVVHGDVEIDLTAGRFDADHH